MTITPVAVYLLYFIFSNPDSHLCTVQDRTSSCSSQDTQPICVLYTGDDCSSYTGLCLKTVQNGCASCQDATVVGYTLGECEQSQLPQMCTVSDLDAQCSQEAAPTCGYAESHRLGRHNAYTKSSYNACDACRDDKVAFRLPGECRDSTTLNVCDKKVQNKECKASAAPTCAYYTGNDCTEQVCKKTVEDSCSICQDSSVLFYVDGACEAPSSPVKVETESLSAPVGIASLPPVIIDNDEVNEDFEDIALDDGSDENEDRIPELEAVVQPDGSILFEKVEPPRVPVSDPPVECIHGQLELEAVIQEDGSIFFVTHTEEDSLTEENDNSEMPDIDDIHGSGYTPLSEQFEPIEQPDGSILFDRVGPSVNPMAQPESAKTSQFVGEPAKIPHLERAFRPDGSVVYTRASHEDGSESYSPLEPIEKRI